MWFSFVRRKGSVCMLFIKNKKTSVKPSGRLPLSLGGSLMKKRSFLKV